MRIKLVFSDKRKEVLKIEKDYRRYFISFLKNVFARTGLFKELYSVKKVKPFSFSVYFGKEINLIEEGEEEVISFIPPLNLLFSTGDPVILSNFYNGVLSLKKEKNGVKWPGGHSVPLSEIIIERNLKIRTSCVIFRTIGICVITDPKQKAKDFENWFCVPNEENLVKFNSIFRTRMLEKYERIKGYKINTEIKFTPVSKKDIEIFIRQGKLNISFGTEPIKEVYVKHYGGFIKGFKGVFYVESHPEMLQFIYDYGLGVRTGQGFGLLEVIAQI